MIDPTNYPRSYSPFFARSLDRLHSDRRYRVFTELERIAAQFPDIRQHVQRSRDLVLERLSRHRPASEGH
jgi:hypothetical protein